MSTLIENLAGAAVEVVIFGVAGGILYRVWRDASFLPQRKTLLPFNRGVVLEGERVVRVVEPGSYWISPKQSMVPVDVRARPLQTEQRELFTADKQRISLSFSGEYKVVEPSRFVVESTNGHGAFHLALETEISRAVAELSREELLQGTASPAERVRERIEPRAAELGIAISHLEVSDMIPFGWEPHPSDH
jgi:regulator of protease activity HflC (stomatin/prohibitin superfamily)